jgi:transposase-like protein
MSSEHATVIIRAKCRNRLTCGIESTLIVPANGSQNTKIQCPHCHQFTMKKDLDILIVYPKVKVP